MLGEVARGVAVFYAWAIAGGVVALVLVMLGQSALDALRDAMRHRSRRRDPRRPVRALANPERRTR